MDAFPLELLFVFQAEDGIRVHCVTGVQTCALPIYVDGTEQSITAAQYAICLASFYRAELTALYVDRKSVV